MTAEHDDLDPAELAVLDMALEEALGDERHERAPRDVWPALVPRAHAHRTARRAGPRSWLVAALMLLGLCVVGGVVLLRDRGDAFATRPLRDPDGPKSVAELVDRLQRAREGSVHVRGCWSVDQNRWVPLERMLLDDLFRWSLRPLARASELQTIAASLATANERPVDDDIVWTHWLVTTGKDSACSVVLQWREGAPPRVGYLGPRGAVPLDVAAFPLDELPSLEELRRTTLETLGIVVDFADLARLPATATSLTMLGVGGHGAGELRRFPKLTRLRLDAAPEWQTTEVLGALAAHRLESLCLRGDLVAADGYAMLARIPTLTELSLIGDPMRMFLPNPRGRPLPALDDAALRQLGTLPALRELALADGTFGDDGLRALAGTQMKDLVLIACDHVRGHTLGELHGLTRLALVDCRGLERGCLARIGALPKLDQLGLQSPARDLGLHDLPANTSLRNLALLGRFDSSQLTTLARCAKLTKLELWPRPSFTEADLEPLRELRQLRSLSLMGGDLPEAALQSLRTALPECRVAHDTNVPNPWR